MVISVVRCLTGWSKSTCVVLAVLAVAVRKRVVVRACGSGLPDQLHQKIRGRYVLLVHRVRIARVLIASAITQLLTGHLMGNVTHMRVGIVCHLVLVMRLLPHRARLLVLRLVQIVVVLRVKPFGMLMAHSGC